ncbi:MAG: NAD(P)H-hydrate dehydratase, partial [Cardiobacteriaceae bacterium]|nr:NAD(P)H-hydrate dehydratase [Cardiobacteriaceae bacterium]
MFNPLHHFPALFAPRAPDSHKGDHGTLAILGGAAGMSGAIVLAASAALISGCGRVFAAFCQPALPAPWIAGYPEIMLATARDIFERDTIDTWAIGCGLGTDSAAHAALARLIDHCHTRAQPLLLDADALNLLAQDPALAARLAAANILKILTPHPGEAARLLGSSARAINAQRDASALALAERYCAWIVLKGQHSRIASPDGRCFTNPSGNAALATAGSGDVLTGIIAALLAQRIPVEQAVRGGVWLHGAAADHFLHRGVPLAGLLAGEIAPAARQLRQRLAAEIISKNKQK